MASRGIAPNFGEDEFDAGRDRELGQLGTARATMLIHPRLNIIASGLPKIMTRMPERFGEVQQVEVSRTLTIRVMGHLAVDHLD